jgi:carbamoyltransferase
VRRNEARRPPRVLGLCSFTHDSSAALVADGRLVGMVEEERLSGIKHTKKYPFRGITWLLDEAGIDAADIDVVAYNFAGSRYLAAVPGSLPLILNGVTRRDAFARARGFTLVNRYYRQRMAILRARFPSAKVQPVLHHRAHGLYALASSGYDRAAVIIVDSLGETQSTTIGLGTKDGGALDYRIVQAIHDPASLGYVYGAVTQHLGWRRGDEEGTVMALAALGDPARFRPVFSEGVRLTADAFYVDPSWFPLRTLLPGRPRVTARFTEATCPTRAADQEVTQIHADVAAALQERTEQVMLHLARRARQLTGARLLCLGGGVAMNCVSVGAIAQSGLFDEVSVPPAPGDSGTAIGAAIGVHQILTGQLPADVVGRCYLGPRYASDQPRPPSGVDAEHVGDAASFLADRLAEGQIIGLFQGALEAGPRALGNRSILASPLLPRVVERLNKSVKYREDFRPFAPVVLAERASDYFVLNQPSPFMSIAADATARAREQIPSVVHVNGTARVQTITKEENAFLAEVLRCFAERTGIPVLINTSLNIKGKPICGTPQAALECLHEARLDGLMFEGGWWVKR